MTRSIAPLPPRRFASGRGKVVGGSGAQELVASYRNQKLSAVVPDFKLRPGFLYTQVRAISARINQNYDAWPSGELKKYYRSFLGKPIFVNHQNEDPTKARGRVVAARYIESGDDKFIEVIQEVDAQRFPKLAKEIREGGMDSVSMGVEAGFTICSVCENRATDIFDMCGHVKLHKGEYLPNHKTGRKTLVYENCYKLGFFELSYVFDPADETAVVSRVIAAGKQVRVDDRDRDGAGVCGECHRADGGEHWPGCPQELGYRDPDKYLDPDDPRIKGAGRRTAKPVVAKWYHDSDKSSSMMGGGHSLHIFWPHRSPDIIDRNGGGIQGRNSPFEWVHTYGGEPVNGGSAGTFENAQKQAENSHKMLAGGWNPDEDAFDPRKESRRMAQKRRRLAYGEIEAPEDIDTMRDESEDDGTDQWHHFVKSPPELQDPDMDKVHRLDREQEEEGLDEDRRSEDVEDIESSDQENQPAMPVNPPATKKGRHTSNQGVPMSRRRGRNHYAEEGFAPEGGNEEAELIAQAEADLAQAEQEALGGGDEGYGDEGYGDESGYGDEEGYGDESDESDEGYGDEGDEGDEGEYGEEAEYGDEDPDYDGDDDSSPEGDYDQDYAGAEDGGGEEEYMPREGRTVRRRASRRNVRKGGTRMGTLADRGLFARTAGRRHYAEEYGVDDSQGAQEEVFLSDVPGAVPVVLPEYGQPISNTENNLVASRATFDPRHYQRLADVVSALPVDARKAMADRVVRMFQADNRAFNPRTFFVAARVPVGIRAGRYVFAEELVDPSVVNPSLPDTGGNEIKGDDFTDLSLDAVETQPKDASRHYFAEFDRWLAQTTGRTAAQHGNANFIRRSAARYVKASGRPLAALFPTLDYVLAQARKTEGRNAMRRRAEDTSLEVAAPEGRMDVEAPVQGVTSPKAQESQFDTGDFGSNAGDNLADPNLDTGSQIWAPDKVKESKLASAVAAVRCARAHIEAGLSPKEDEWKLVARFETLRHATVVDRTRLLEAVIQANKAKTARKVTAASSRGTGRGIPMGLGSGTRTAGVSKVAANDPDTDSLMFF